MSIVVNRKTFSGDSFNLHENSTPVDEKQFLQGLTILADHALNVLSNYPKEIEGAFQSIEKVIENDFDANDHSCNTHLRIEEVFKKWVKVFLGDQSLYIPRERLTKECGEKFKGQFSCIMKEERDRTVNLSLPEGLTSQQSSSSLFEAFLNYLQTGDISDDALEEDVMTLLSLADQHRVDGLITKCIELVEENLDLDNLEVVLDFIENRHLPRLTMACLFFIQAHEDRIPLEVRIAHHKELILLKEMLKCGMELGISPKGTVEVQIKFISKNTVKFLKKLNILFPIKSMILVNKRQELSISFFEEISPIIIGIDELIVTGANMHENTLTELKILFPKLKSFGNDSPFLKNFCDVKAYLKYFRKPGVANQDFKKPNLLSLNLEAIHNLTDKQIEELSPYLQGIFHLFIKSDKINTIVAPKATWIGCCNCTALTTLEILHAKVIKCSNCTSLKTLEANQAAKIICSNCTNLKTISAPQANWINCSCCLSLKILKVPRAINIDCSGCTNLIILEAPTARNIYCVGCNSLTKIEADQAEIINSLRCINLKTLIAHHAQKIICPECTSLTTLKVPQAQKIICLDCTSLTSIEAHQAQKIICPGCTSLKTIEAPQALVLDSRNCTNLSTIEADQAERIICYNCTNLTTLVANEATEIDCSSCTSLTTIIAPQAEVLLCYSCSSLTTLEAPRTKEFECSDCTSLKILNVYQAIKIICSNCTSLTTIIAPRAENIVCSNCPNLVTIDAPNAKEILK